MCLCLGKDVRGMMYSCQSWKGVAYTKAEKYSRPLGSSHVASRWMSSGLTGVCVWGWASWAEGTPWEDVLGKLSIYEASVYWLMEKDQS